MSDATKKDETKTDPAAPNPLSPEAIEAARNEQQAQAARDAAKKPAKEDESGPVTKLKQVNVLIFRNEFTTIADTVFEHEVRILQALHGGADAVKITGEDTVDVYGFDPNDELARLQRKYRSKEVDVVGMVYQNDPRRIAEEAGVSFKAGDARKPARSTQTPAKKKPIGKKR